MVLATYKPLSLVPNEPNCKSFSHTQGDGGRGYMAVPRKQRFPVANAKMALVARKPCILKISLVVLKAGKKIAI